MVGADEQKLLNRKFEGVADSKEVCEEKKKKRENGSSEGAAQL